MNTKATRKSPVCRGRWTEDQLREALRMVRAGMAVRRAADVYSIPRRTLRNHIKTGVEMKKMGRNSILTSAQENELCNRIFRLASIGYPLTGKLIRRSVFVFCQENNINNPFPEGKGMAGKKWLNLFRKRHPNLTKRKAQHMNQARAAKLNKFIVTDHFDKLRSIMTEMNILANPHLIYNMDEKGCQLSLHKQPMVFAKKASKDVRIIADEHAENVTIVACGNAIGQIIPPMILFKGKREKEEWKENLPIGSCIQMTKKGSMTTETFVKWIQHFAKFKCDEKVLLIFDGASSHLDYTIVDEAEMHNIVLYCLPSNTTHYLQPMDRSVFGPFETYWDNEVMLFWTNRPHHKITKFHFGSIFSKAWAKAATPVNVSSGFRATGIYPFNSNAIPDDAFAPSEVTFRKAPLVNNENVAPNFVADEIASETEPQPGPSGLSKKNRSCIARKRQNSSSSEISTDSFSVQDSESSLGEIDHDDQGQDEQPEHQTPEKTESESQKNHIIDNVSLTKEKNVISFKKFLPTPDVEEKKVTPKRKSLNYRAQQVTKDLFQKQDEEKDSKKRQPKKPKKVIEKWYCHLCQEDRVADMRLCNMCLRYVHEECVGLTSRDKEPTFLCPPCTRK